MRQIKFPRCPIDRLIANAAAYVGLVYALVHEGDDETLGLPFEAARLNFYAAAREGLRARLQWPGAGEAAPRDLLEQELLPRAARGLPAAERARPGSRPASRPVTAIFLNFRDMKPGAALGHRTPGCEARLLVLPGGQAPLQGEYFDYSDGEIRLVRPVVPAMLTTDPLAVKNDCLCYLMERIGV